MVGSVVPQAAQGLMALLIAAPEEFNVFLVAVATCPADAMHVAAMSETMRAYSTAVGPSSSTRSRLNLLVKV